MRNKFKKKKGKIVCVFERHIKNLPVKKKFQAFKIK